MKKINKLKNFIGSPRFNTTDFWTVCPYTLDELRMKNRKNQFRVWRQVGHVWYRLSGYTLEDVGDEFRMNHSTVVNSEKVVFSAVRGESNDTGIIQAINSIINHCEGYVEDSGEQCVNEVSSMVTLESVMNRNLVK